MKIVYSYKIVRQHTLYKPTLELDPSTLSVTELNDPNVSYHLGENKTDGSQIKCLRFFCSEDDFDKLPSPILAACKQLLEKFPSVTRIEFSPSKFSSNFSPTTSCDPRYLDLLIDSRERSPKGNNAKISLNLIKSIHAYHFRDTYAYRFMPYNVFADISGCIYSYIKNNGYFQCVAKFEQHFKPEQAYNWALTQTVGGFAFSATCLWGFLKTLNKIGYHSSALAAMTLLAPICWAFSPPELVIKNGGVSFYDASRRVDLIKLYKDIGGKHDYQLWEETQPEPSALTYR